METFHIIYEKKKNWGIKLIIKEKCQHLKRKSDKTPSNIFQNYNYFLNKDTSFESEFLGEFINLYVGGAGILVFVILITAVKRFESILEI